MEEREGIKPRVMIRLEVILGSPEGSVGLYTERLIQVIMGLFAMIGIPPISCSFEIQNIEENGQGLDDDIDDMTVH